MRLLVIGGTRFVGRNFVEVARAAGYDCTLFNRGQSDPSAFPDIEQIRGDREKDLSALEGRSFDAVFDPSCYVPQVASMSAQLLAVGTPYYGFVSSLSVYSDGLTPNLDESAELATIPDPTIEDVDEYYGALKVLCEREIQAVYANRALIIRAGFIVGPHDDVDRLAYWIRRIVRGGEVLAPASPDYPVQMIDARDIALWSLSMIGRGAGGVFNVTGPQPAYGLGEVLDTIKRVTRSDATFTWVPEEFLLEQRVGPWDGLPYWLGPEWRGTATLNVSKALAAGLTLRPLEETVRDTFDWDRTRPTDLQLRAGIPPEREEELLAAWHAR